MKIATHNLTVAIEAVHTEAEKRRSDAGYSGAMNDGGASQLENEVAVFLLGLNFARTGEIPDSWAKAAQDAINKLDPEYAEFLRLQAKFGK